jgi:hypothetical protein
MPSEMMDPESVRAFTFSEGACRARPELPEEARIAGIRRNPSANRAAVTLRAWRHLKSVAIVFRHRLAEDQVLTPSDVNDWIDGEIAAESAYADRFETADSGQANCLRLVHVTFGFSQSVIETPSPTT